MIDHFTLTVPDLARSKEFYRRALEPLGYSVLMDFGEMVGFGDRQKPYFWLKAGPSGTQPMHMAFEAPSREAVEAFYAAALAGGARDNGRPGPRSDYHPNYYGAFVIELDGHPIEAVCHLSPEQLAGSQVTRKAGAAKKAPKSTKKSAPRKSAKKSAKKSAPPKSTKKKSSAKRKSAPKKRR